MATTLVVCCGNNRYRRYIGRTFDFAVDSDQRLPAEVIETIRSNPSQLVIEEDGVA